MKDSRLSTLLAVAALLAGPAWSLAQPAPPPAAADAPPPHVLRLEGDSAQVQREGTAEPLVEGDPVLYGDRVDTGNAYVQVLWGEGTRVGLDRGSRMEALAPELLALTAGRALITRPAAASQPLRVDTPAASVVLRAGGECRLTLEGESTTIAVTRGQADVQSGMGEQAVAAGQQVALRDGVAPDAPRRFNAAGYDSFVQWATAPNPTPTGGAPLDTFTDPRFEAYADVFNRHGSWESDAQYGAVWFPAVAADWRPYADGYWQPWGGQSQWLWVGRDPWGWPTHHFGRWNVNGRGRWFWTPGRQWAPAWVSWSLGPGYVGWTPLGSRDQPLYAWDDLTRARGRGVYPSGTLDPGRAWTVIPSERFGRRDRLGAYAVDPRTLDNLSAFVSQRVGPPLRYGVPRGAGYGPLTPGPYAPYGGPGGTTVVGPRGYYGGVRRTGDSTTPSRGPIGPTRVGPESPGYGGPTPPPDDPYERAQRAVEPRGRARVPSDAPATDGPATAPRQRTPREAPPAASPTPQRQAPPAAAPPRDDNNAAPVGRAGSTTSRAGESTGRRAQPRP